jgi:transcriptional regulator with XRE-family HTH domain
VAHPRRTSSPLADELPRLLREKGLTLRGLARVAGVNHSHLSRMIRHDRGQRPSADLAERIAEALDLPRGFFPESREAVVVEEVRRNGDLRDELYDRLTGR